jgi:hypothetical protein
MNKLLMRFLNRTGGFFINFLRRSKPKANAAQQNDQPMFSWWNSLDVVSRISSISNCLIALLGIWVFVIGRRENELEGEQTEKANKARDALISETQLKTEATILETARATKEAALANERSLALEKENLQLKLKLQPREISDEQSAKFIDSTKKGPFGPVDVVTDVSAGPEAKDYAEAMRKLLRQAGFKAREPDFDMVDLLGFNRGGVLPGVILWIKDPNAEPAFAPNLQRGLEAIGIEALGEKNTSVAPGAVMLFVGKKP